MNAAHTDTLLQVRAARRYGTLSPLRYPGGKASLAGFFADVIEALDLTDPTYVEPYAGGAGAGVALLVEGHVDRLVVNDFDPAVHSFWVAATEHCEALCALVADKPLTVEEWRRQKAVYRAADDTDPLALGFAFFYLNRTNRSGILNAGPIGGVNQTGNYKIDARFNRPELVRRLEAIGERAHRITVSNKDGRSIVQEHASDPNAFLYIDPPYLAAGGSLYLNAFTHRDHADLAATVRAYPHGNWVVTYDDAPYIRRLYEGEAVQSYALYYSAHRAVRSTELAVLSPSVSGVVATGHADAG
ncbi:DNA adenine methylase [Tessaracoccus lacteus]|uniref:site-specific DNA-methyltransferase (adenine-specific) n=1 Tax=Tessaracoccus lacteus TaxID=3041766 RepID=A0ABY8Q1P6_9ACTN|nr:DNA adenine methylase [Tessaracoccus sp. T21]WGT48418.1 DNA adenine methylase [Tessaracoccus sp. T21]